MYYSRNKYNIILLCLYLLIFPNIIVETTTYEQKFLFFENYIYIYSFIDTNFLKNTLIFMLHMFLTVC